MVDAGNSGKSSFPITIWVDRQKRLVRILDEAQGMTLSELELKFEEYGAAKSSAYEGGSSRGIFGQGISDVLFYHKDGRIKSIKNNEASVCEFYKKRGKPYISVQKSPNSVEQSAREWGISNGHGTVIEFTVDDTTTIHDFENLVRRVGNFYMLRLINANAEREVKIEYKERKGTKKARVTYRFPDGELVQPTKTFEFTFEDYNPVKVEVQLYRSNTPLPTTDEERANGLLVYDEKNAVYDQTFFGLEGLRGADKYFGMMKLTGAREIILDKINAEKPQAILTDSRDGFDKQHDFFKKLSSEIKDWLYPILSEEGKRKTDEGLSEDTQENHRRALEELNKLYAELAGEGTSGTIRQKRLTRPSGGIAFARNTISITEGRRYGLQLVIDTQVLGPGSVITLKERGRNIKFSPSTITVGDEATQHDGLISKTILISGKKAGSVDTLVATSGAHRAAVVVSIVAEEVVYPENGLVFSPDYVRVAPEKKHSLNLFVDTKVIKVGSQIAVTSSNENIVLIKKTVKVPVGKKNNIVRIPISFSTKEPNEIGFIEAVHKDFVAQCHVDIKDPAKTPPSNPAGKFRGWMFDENVPRGLQTTYDHIPGSPTQGYILISSTHPINREYFGDNPDKLTVDSSRTAQLYLAELVLNESLGAMVGEAYQKGIIQPTYGPAIDIPVYVAQKKFELGPKVYAYIASSAPTLSSLKRNQKLVAAKEAHGVKADLLEVLEGRSRELVAMYFGLDEQRPHTLDEIGLKVGVTRERVRQIINKALAPKQTKFESGIDTEQAEEIDDAWVDYIQEEENKIRSASDRIVETTAKVFSISSEEIKEKTRRVGVAIPRQVAIYLLREVLKLSYPSIGRIFDMDHTTVIYAHRKVETVIKKDERMAKKVGKITSLAGPTENLLTLQNST